MKKRMVMLLIVLDVLFSYGVMASTFFTDVASNFWAYPYIVHIQESNVINGYPDGTFKPQKQVTYAEFIKMTCMVVWRDFEYISPPSYMHWAMPYVKALENICYLPGAFDDVNLLNRAISRGDAVKILSDAILQYRYFSGLSRNYSTSESYLKGYPDMVNETDQELKRSLIICTQFNVINGFEDGTFRKEATLTRAQVAKMMDIILK